MDRRKNFSLQIVFLSWTKARLKASIEKIKHWSCAGLGMSIDQVIEKLDLFLKQKNVHKDRWLGKWVGENFKDFLPQQISFFFILFYHQTISSLSVNAIQFAILVYMCVVSFALHNFTFISHFPWLMLPTFPLCFWDCEMECCKQSFRVKLPRKKISKFSQVLIEANFLQQW